MCDFLHNDKNLPSHACTYIPPSFSQTSVTIGHGGCRMVWRRSYSCTLTFQAAAFTSLGAIIISTFCFILSTFPELQEDDNNDTNLTSLQYDETFSNDTSGRPLLDLGDLPSPSVDFDTLRLAFKIIDLTTICYFTLEYIVRFTCAPRKLKFFFQVCPA